MKREFTVQIHVTDKCGVDCPHCYIGDQRLSAPQHMSFGVFKKSIDQLKYLTNSISDISGNVIDNVVHITGGDPLLNPEITEMLTHLKENNIKIGILGNPTNTGNLKNLKDNFGITSYQISIDGLPDYHDKIRGKGRFKQAIDFLNKARYLNIKTFVIMNVNIENVDQIVGLYKYLSNLENPPFSFTFARVATIGNAMQSKISSKEIDPLYYRDVFKKLDIYKETSTVKLTMKDPLWSLYLYEIGKLKVYEGVFHGGCGAGISLFSIDVNGDVTPCRRYPINVGSITNTTLKDIYFKSNTVHSFREKSTYSKCSTCELFYHCRGCPAIGNIGNDPQCWK